MAYGDKYHGRIDVRTAAGSTVDVYLSADGYTGPVMPVRLANLPIDAQGSKAGSHEMTAVRPRAGTLRLHPSEATVADDVFGDDTSWRLRIEVDGQVDVIGPVRKHLRTLSDEKRVTEAIKIQWNDGLGSLQEVPFAEADGTRYSERRSVIAWIVEILRRTDLGLDVAASSEWYASHMTDGTCPLEQEFVKAAPYQTDEGPLSCFDVLKDLARAKGAFVCQERGRWHVYQRALYRHDDFERWVYPSAWDDGATSPVPQVYNAVVTTPDDYTDRLTGARSTGRKAMPGVAVTYAHQAVDNLLPPWYVSVPVQDPVTGLWTYDQDYAWTVPAEFIQTVPPSFSLSDITIDPNDLLDPSGGPYTGWWDAPIEDYDSNTTVDGTLGDGIALMEGLRLDQGLGRLRLSLPCYFQFVRARLEGAGAGDYDVYDNLAYAQVVLTGDDGQTYYLRRQVTADGPSFNYEAATWSTDATSFCTFIVEPDQEQTVECITPPLPSDGLVHVTVYGAIDQQPDALPDESNGLPTTLYSFALPTLLPAALDGDQPEARTVEARTSEDSDPYEVKVRTGTGPTGVHPGATFVNGDAGAALVDDWALGPYAPGDADSGLTAQDMLAQELLYQLYGDRRVLEWTFRSVRPSLTKAVVLPSGERLLPVHTRPVYVRDHQTVHAVTVLRDEVTVSLLRRTDGSGSGSSGGTGGGSSGGGADLAWSDILGRPSDLFSRSGQSDTVQLAAADLAVVLQSDGLGIGTGTVPTEPLRIEDAGDLLLSVDSAALSVGTDVDLLTNNLTNADRVQVNNEIQVGTSSTYIRPDKIGIGVFPSASSLRIRPQASNLLIQLDDVSETPRWFFEGNRIEGRNEIGDQWFSLEGDSDKEEIRLSKALGSEFSGDIELVTGPVHGEDNQPGGVLSFNGAALVPNNDLVVFAPDRSDYVGLYNYETQTYTRGPAATQGGNRRYGGATFIPDLGAEGTVFMIPKEASRPGLYDVATNTFDESTAQPFPSGEYLGAATLTDGRVVSPPRAGTRDLVVYTPQTGSTPASIDTSITLDDNGWSGALVLQDGRVMFTPRGDDDKPTYILIYDPNPDPGDPVTKKIPTGQTGTFLYDGDPIQLNDGRVLLVPRDADHIGLFDPVTDTFNEGPEIIGTNKFIGGGQLADQRVIFAPFDAAKFGVFDPLTDKYDPNGPTSPKELAYGIYPIRTPDGRVVLAPSAGDTIDEIIYDFQARFWSLGVNNDKFELQDGIGIMKFSANPSMSRFEIDGSLNIRDTGSGGKHLTIEKQDASRVFEIHPSGDTSIGFDVGNSARLNVLADSTKPSLRMEMADGTTIVESDLARTRFNQSIGIYNDANIALLQVRGQTTNDTLLQLEDQTGTPTLKADDTFGIDSEIQIRVKDTARVWGDVIPDIQGQPFNSRPGNLGLPTDKWLTVNAFELNVDNLVAREVVSTIGGRLFVGESTVLLSEIGFSQQIETILTRHNNLSDGDYLFFEANAVFEAMAVRRFTDSLWNWNSSTDTIEITDQDFSNRVRQMVISFIGGPTTGTPIEIKTDVGVYNAIAVEDTSTGLFDLEFSTAPSSVPTEIDWIKGEEEDTGNPGHLYKVLRDADQTGSSSWAAGTSIRNTGTKGAGFIDQYAINSQSTGTLVDGPAIAFMERTDSQSVFGIRHRALVGNLSNKYDYGSGDRYGIAAGDFTNNWFSVDDLNGFRLMEGTTEVVKLNDDIFFIGSEQIFRFDNTPGAERLNIGGLGFAQSFYYDVPTDVLVVGGWTIAPDKITKRFSNLREMSVDYENELFVLDQYFDNIDDGVWVGFGNLDNSPINTNEYGFGLKLNGEDVFKVDESEAIIAGWQFTSAGSIERKYNNNERIAMDYTNEFFIVDRYVSFQNPEGVMLAMGNLDNTIIGSNKYGFGIKQNGEDVFIVDETGIPTLTNFFFEEVSAETLNIIDNTTAVGQLRYNTAGALQLSGIGDSAAPKATSSSSNDIELFTNLGTVEAKGLSFKFTENNSESFILSHAVLDAGSSLADAAMQVPVRTNHPANPPSGSIYVYAKNNGSRKTLHTKDSSGNVRDLSLT